MHSVEIAHAVTWIVCGLTIVGVVTRPWRVAEAIWASAGAGALVALGLISVPGAFDAIKQGFDVYLFLVGMMLLAEVARAEGLFDWLAGAALAAAGGTPFKLFALVYGVGTVITIFLSNDATAVVLTPAIVAVLRRTEVDPLPYAFAGAFVANAASFVLPISNPANLVVFGRGVPTLFVWLARFGLPALVAIVATFALLALVWRRTLRAGGLPRGQVDRLDRRGCIAAAVLTVALIALVVVSALGADIGIATLILGAVALVVIALTDRPSVRPIVTHITWSIVPLVAGLFVVVTALDRTGALDLFRTLLRIAAAHGTVVGGVIVAGVVTVASALLNNLPVALVAQHAFTGGRAVAQLRDAWLVAVDLGPNLTTNASLATLLWLVMLRRDGIVVTPAQFFRVGLLVLPPSLIAAILVTR
ncbi:MAG: SLC13 family permease [Vulcanimicrobiaceae bacterium]